MKTAPAVVTPWRVVPVSMSDRAFWTAAAATPAVEPLLRDAEPLPATPHVGQASDFLAARRFNDRNRIDMIWQHTRVSLSALAVRRAVRGLEPDDSDDRLLDWLWAFLTQPTWVVSAHLPGNDLPASGAPQLDLAACEMAALMADVAVVLDPWIRSVSGTLADSIVAEIDRRVLGPFGDGFEIHWHSPSRTYLNNWTGVCAGAILSACESLALLGHPRPEARERALTALRLFFDAAFTEHGECDEGVGYWNYGVGVACMGLSRLPREELQRRLDLDRLAQVADYPRRAHLFDDAFFCGNDAPLRATAPRWFVPWLGAVTGNAWLLQWAVRSPAHSVRHLGMLLGALQVPPDALPESAPPPPEVPPEVDPEPAHEPAVLLPDQQAAILRLDTPRGELLATLSGGTNGERHNHNDLGQFTFALAGRVLVPDLGNIRYTADFFGPRRYTYIAASSRGHNCPVINGQEQRPGGEAAGRILGWDEQAGRLSLDLTAAYPPEAGLRRWTRTLQRDDEGYTLIDEYETAHAGVEIDHVVWSLEAPTWTADHEAVLEDLSVAVTPAASARTAEPHNAKEMKLREYNDRHPHRTRWTYHTDDAGRLRVETRIRLKA